MALGDFAKLPLPQVQPLLVEFSLKHIGDVFTNHGDEFKPVVGSNRGDEKVLRSTRVRTDPKVQIACYSVPKESIVSTKLTHPDSHLGKGWCEVSWLSIRGY